MALPTFYAAGTVSVANGGTTVTGVGTAWVGKVYPGDLFADPAQPLVPPQRVASVTDDTHLVLWAGWPGTAMTSDPYEARITPDTARVQERTRQLLEALTSAANVGFVPPGGMTADDVQAALEELNADIEGFEALPDGGTTGQVLKKQSSADGDADWEDEPTGFDVAANYAVSGNWMFDGPVKIGHNRNPASYVGLQIGGAVASEGTDGATLATDSYAGWIALQNTKEGGVTELAVQPKALASQASITSAGNTVTAVNAIFSAGLVGKRIYLGDTAYLISAYTDTTHVTVTNLNGSAASFPATATVTALVAGAGGVGLCDTAGTAVTRVSGDPFVPLSNTPYKIKINGTTYTVSSWTDIDTLVLTGSAGTQSNVAYEWWTSVDDVVSALRVHRISRAGFEENVSLIAYGTGKFHLHAGGGDGRQYPLHLGSGYKTSGAERDHVTLAGDGYTYIGGDASAYSMRVGHADDVAGNVFEFLATPATYSPSLRARGVDADVGIAFDTKGNGAFIITSGSFTGRDLVVYGNHAGDYLGLGGVSGAPFIEAAGASTNIDIALVPKGTGRVRVGSTPVLTTRRTGWAAPTGTATRTTFATSSVTLPLLAERVKALIDDLTTHGLIGT